MTRGDIYLSKLSPKYRKLADKRLELMGVKIDDILLGFNINPERKSLRAVQYPNVGQAISYLFKAPAIWAFAKIYYNGSNFQLYVPGSQPKKRKRRTKSRDTD